MNIRFEPNPQLAPDTVNVTVEAAKLNAEALQVLQLLEENQNASSGLTRLPLLVDDKTIMVASQDLIAMEVYQNELTVYTQEATYLVKGQLNKMLERLDGRDFV
nr:LytTR family DNA-binding domain-containing protein [Abiotrophia defectiva]